MHAATIFLLLVNFALCNFASGAPDIEVVRADMRRVLSTSEREAYRGITDAGMSGVKFQKLFNVATAEDLVKAQRYSITLRPFDDSGTSYLFADEVGLVASFNLEYTEKNEAGWQHLRKVETETLNELDAKYKVTKTNDPYSEYETEELLNSVAAGFLSWSSGQSGVLETRQQGYYCKKKNALCGNRADCSPIRTIQRYTCNCNYNTCITDGLPLPPYPGCPGKICA